MGLQFTATEIEDNTLPEETIFRATLQELKEHTFEWTDQKVNPPVKKTSTTLQWWFEVHDPEQYRGRKVKGECRPDFGNSKSTGAPTRFKQWAEALLDREIPTGMVIDVDDLVGLSADITVRHEPDRKDPAKKWERVDEVITATGASSAFDSTPPF